MTCITLAANSVAIDCNHHAIGSVSLQPGQSNTTLTNCAFSGLSISGSQNWTITDSTFTQYLLVHTSHGFVLRHSTFMAADPTIGSGVEFNGGSGNTATGNTIDGGYHGQCSQCGTDDGILVVGEDSDTVQGNTIANVWDAGIETVGTFTNSTIANNVITNATFTGIGAYWCSHWQGNSVTGNSVSASERLLFMTYDVGSACPAPAPSGVFTGNTLANNVLRNASPVPPDAIGAVLQFAVNGLTANNNTLQGNDVGSFGIDAAPAVAFANGGGNVCGPAGTFGC